MTTGRADPFAFIDVRDTEAAEFPLIPPGKTDPVMVLTLAGPIHEKRVALMDDRRQRLRDASAKEGRVVLPDAASDREFETALLVEATLGWTGPAAPEFSPTLARALYEDKSLSWVRDAVKAALDERQRFTRRSATS